MRYVITCAHCDELRAAMTCSQDECTIGSLALDGREWTPGWMKCMLTSTCKWNGCNGVAYNEYKQVIELCEQPGRSCSMVSRVLHGLVHGTLRRWPYTVVQMYNIRRACRGRLSLPIAHGCAKTYVTVGSDLAEVAPCAIVIVDTDSR